MGVILRSKEDVIIEFGLSEKEFESNYYSYEISLELLAGDKDWNKEIRGSEQKFCTEKEVEEGKEDFNQAVLNRVIVSCSWS